MNHFLLLISALFLSSCALAPFSASTSARSYGAGKLQVELGNVNNAYNIKLGFGASDNMDIGYVMEFGSMSSSAIFLKYASINNKVGPSLAWEFGYGSSSATSFYYAGSVGSLALSDGLEFFVNPRINVVNTSEEDVTLNQSIGIIKVKEYSTTYLQVAYGVTIWMSEIYGMSLYSEMYKGKNIETTKGGTFGATFIMNY